MTTTISPSVGHTTHFPDLPARDDALHERALEHMQAGEWDAAVECLSTLVERHPDQEHFEQLLKQAQLKIKLDKHPPRRRTGRTWWRSRAIWALVLLNLVIWLGLLGRQIYYQQVVPALSERQMAAQHEQLVNKGRASLVNGDLSQAVAYFEEALKINPDGVAAQTGLEEAERRQHLAQMYDSAQTSIEQENWEAALATLEILRRDAPAYRDVQQQIDRVRELRALSVRFDGAKQQFQSGNLMSAVQQLLLLKQEAPEYKPAAVNSLIVDIYMDQAEAAVADAMQSTTRDIADLQGAVGSLSELVRNATQDIERLQEAMQYFRQALEVDPTATEASTQLELAQQYISGVEAYRDGNWELASVHLANIYPVAPGYANGRAAALLQATYVQNGLRYERKEAYERTAERYRQAIALGTAGYARPAPAPTTDVLTEADDLMLQGQYQEAAIRYGYILSRMGFATGTDAAEIMGDQLAWQRPDITRDMLPEEEPAPEEQPTEEVYVVRPNDTLSQIARQYNTTVSGIMTANDIIRNRNLIRPGWRLVIPRP